MIETVQQLREPLGVRAACQALSIPRSSYYCAKKGHTSAPHPTSSPRALAPSARKEVLDTLNDPRFQDQAPREVYATLLDEGLYLCHWRTMYRVLASAEEVRERRDQLQHPTYIKPELLATRPNELWSWDITRLLGPAKWTYFYLYVILDVYSRYVVGWMVALQEAAHLAEILFLETCQKQNIQPGQLTLHADRGNPMNSKPFAMLLADLGVTKTHSRPHVSNDNPYSEAHFKTFKYFPAYPTRFGSLIDARNWSGAFFNWYNFQHHHTGIALLTPADVHYSRAEQVLAHRQQVLQGAYLAHPERFVNGLPKVDKLPEQVWINPPEVLHPERIYK
jgi:putative transposase